MAENRLLGDAYCQGFGVRLGKFKKQCGEQEQ